VKTTLQIALWWLSVPVVSFACLWIGVCPYFGEGATEPIGWLCFAGYAGFMVWRHIWPVLWFKPAEPPPAVQSEAGRLRWW
jgi:hypothetical protein